GGQLGATTPQKLSEWLAADAVFYSTLEEFNYLLLGYYAQRSVKIQGRLMNAKGDKLWDAERGFSTRTVVTDTKAAQQAFAVQMAAKFVEKLAHIPLQLETREAIQRLLNTLP